MRLEPPPPQPTRARVVISDAARHRAWRVAQARTVPAREQTIGSKVTTIVSVSTAQGCSSIDPVATGYARADLERGASHSSPGRVGRYPRFYDRTARTVHATAGIPPKRELDLGEIS